MILLIDHYDGCANNLYQLAGQVNPDIRIARNDQIEVDEIRTAAPTHIILSGGSAKPEKAGNALDIVKTFAGRIPILGICLGSRIICAAYGAESVQLEDIQQGKRLSVQIDRSTALFRDVPGTFFAGFYRSETVPESNIPRELRVIATSDGYVVGVAHRTQAVFGLEFHPESFLSEHGLAIMRNFLHME